MASVDSAPPPDLRAPARLFCVLALVLGTGYAAINPPFTVNDELYHLGRAYELSLGKLRVEENERSPYLTVPKAWRALAFRFRTLPEEPGRRLTAGKLLRNLSSKVPEEDRAWTLETSLPIGAPFAYSALVPGVTVARVLSLPTLWYVYLARLTSLGAYCGLLCLALSLSRRMFWAWFALGLTPALLTHAGGASPVSFGAGLAFLFVALVDRASAPELQPSTWQRRITLILALVGLVCSNPACILFAPTLSMLRWSEADSRASRWGYTALAALAGGAAACALAYASTGRNPLAFAELGAQQQLHWMVAHPFKTLAIFGRTLFRHLDDYVLQLFVVREVLSDQMRFSAALLATLELELVVLLALGCTWTQAPARARAYLRGAALYVAFAFVSALLAMREIAPNHLQNVRGEFFFPAAPLLVASLAYLGRPIAARWLVRRGGVRVVLFTAGLNVFWLLLLCARYYAPDARPFKYP
jgi:uncharacterized membrane protein